MYWIFKLSMVVKSTFKTTAASLLLMVVVVSELMMLLMSSEPVRGREGMMKEHNFWKSVGVGRMDRMGQSSLYALGENGADMDEVIWG